jgi:hypothetical protein
MVVSPNFTPGKPAPAVDKQTRLPARFPDAVWSGRTVLGATKLLAIISIVLILGSPIKPAAAEDTDRLGGCMAMADMAAAVAKSRDAGVSPDRARERVVTAAIESQSPDQVNAAIRIVYDDKRLTPDQASEKVLESCLQSEWD